MKDNTPQYTDIKKARNGIWAKLDDQYRIAGVCGGKVRACWAIMQAAGNPLGVVTAAGRASVQATIVARLAARLGIPAHCHTATGPVTKEMEDVVAHGGLLFRHKPGYTNVIICRAMEDAKQNGYLYIPYGLESPIAVKATADQVHDIPKEVKRIVIPVGGGINMAGVLHGLQRTLTFLPILGIQIGSDPTKNLDKFAPPFWRGMVEIVKSRYKYSHSLQGGLFGHTLDPIYEAKILEYLQPGDLAWIVGIRTTAGG